MFSLKVIQLCPDKDFFRKNHLWYIERISQNHALFKATCKSYCGHLCSHLINLVTELIHFLGCLIFTSVVNIIKKFPHAFS